MRTPISYYGGKQRMINHILPLIPPHRIYVEPFFGGGSIFFAKGPSFLEVINDTNDNVVNFFRIMKTRLPELNAEIDATLYSESDYKRARKIYRSPRGYSRMNRAWAFWIVSNNSFAHSTLNGGVKFDQGTNGSHTGIVFDRRKKQLKEYEGRLAQVQIECRDALNVIDRRDDPETFFYLDPPYPGADQGPYKGYTSEVLQKLLDVLTGIKGKFMLSNYPSELLDQYVILNDWHVKLFDMRLSAPKRNGDRKREVLVMNYQPENKLF